MWVDGSKAGPQIAVPGALLFLPRTSQVACGLLSRSPAVLADSGTSRFRNGNTRDMRLAKKGLHSHFRPMQALQSRASRAAHPLTPSHGPVRGHRFLHRTPPAAGMRPIRMLALVDQRGTLAIDDSRCRRKVPPVLSSLCPQL